jgi:hypothetical protein
MSLWKPSKGVSEGFAAVAEKKALSRSRATRLDGESATDGVAGPAFVSCNRKSTYLLAPLSAAPCGIPLCFSLATSGLFGNFIFPNGSYFLKEK